MNYKNYIKQIENYPKEGVTFYDISPLLYNSDVFNNICREMEEIIEMYSENSLIVVPESRGFIFGSPIAFSTNRGLFMLHKKDNLPNDGSQTSFKADKEYGESEFVVNQYDLTYLKKFGITNIVIIDDILATGKTALSIVEFFKEYGFTTDVIITAIELSNLKGRELLNKAGYKVQSIIIY